MLITHGPLGAVLLRTPLLAGDLGVYASAQYRQPLHATSGEVGVRLEGAALRGLAMLDSSLSTAVALRLGLGAGVDVVEVRPEAEGRAQVELAEPTVVTVAVARAAVGLELRLSPSAVLLTTLVCDVDGTGTRYVFARASGEQVVLYPFAFRPGLSLGLGFP